VHVNFVRNSDVNRNINVMYRTANFAFNSADDITKQIYTTGSGNYN